MATQTPNAAHDSSLQDLAQSSLRGKTSEVRYVVRQPILDTQSNVHGYELLLWNGSEVVLGGMSELAAHALLGNAMVFGVEELASGRLAFVQCTAESLAEEWVWSLPPKMTVVEVLEDTRDLPRLLELCRKLKELGFRLAVDNFTRNPGARALVELADYVKVDIANIKAPERRFLKGMLAGIPACPIAVNVETQEEYREVWGAGFQLFEGFYFCRPEPVRSHQIPANRALHIEILEVLHKDPVDLDRLSQLVMCDASLTYSLLRLVNSPVCAMRQEVTSIHSALMLLGEERARRIAMLAIANDFDRGEPAELLRMAFERGRFCELAAGLLGLAPSEQYLIGMASMFPAMLRTTMEDLVQLLPLRQEARDALLGKGNREGIFLDLVACQDSRELTTHQAILQSNGLRFEQLLTHLADARAWANAAIQSIH